MKKQTKIGLAGVALAIGFALGGCDNPASDNSSSVNLSADAALSNLTVKYSVGEEAIEAVWVKDGADWESHEFDAEQTVCEFVIPNGTDSVTIEAAARHGAAQVEGNGQKDSLSEGDNTYTVKVTAENGAVREYKLTIIRLDAHGMGPVLAEVACYPIETTIKIEWEPVYGVTSYEVRYAIGDSGELHTIPVTASEGGHLPTSYTITDVEPESSYLVWVIVKREESSKSFNPVLSEAPPEFFTSLVELKNYLSKLPQNTPEMAYRVKLSASPETPFGVEHFEKLLPSLASGSGEYINYIAGLFDALAGKYTYVDMSGITGTDILGNSYQVPVEMHRECLTGLVLPSSLESVGNNVFSGARNLKELVLPGTFKTMGNKAFAYSSIKKLHLPPSIQSIAANAFDPVYSPNGIFDSQDVSTLEEVTCDLTAAIPAETSFAVGFADQTKLKKLLLPDSLASISISNCPLLETLSFPASAETVTITIPPETLRFTVRGEGNYTTNPDGKILTKMDGGMIVAAVGLEGAVVIPDGTVVLSNSLLANKPAITSVVLPSTITSIPNYLCQNSGITSITIHGEVTEIGQAAFSGCTQLTSITLPESLEVISMQAFNGSGLTSIVIPESVSSIGNRAFSGCTSLETVDIRTTSVYNTAGNNAQIFKDCTNLETVYLHQDTTTIPGSVFSGCTSLSKINPTDQSNVNFPPNLVSIGAGTFNGCTQITGHITLPATFQSFGYGAFSNCTGITKFTFPDTIAANLPTDTSSPFTGCTSLVEFELSRGEGAAVFGVLDSGKLLYKLSESNKIYEAVPGNDVDIVVPAQITVPNTVAFQSKGLQSVKFSESTAWPPANGGSYNSSFTGCKRLQTVILKEGGNIVIPNTTFSGCESLTTIKIGEAGAANVLTGVITIGTNAFQNCKALTSITLPDITSFATSYAFRNCTSLQSVTIGPNLASILANTFNGCTALTEVILQKGSVQTLAGTNAFAGCIALESIWVPDGWVESYQSASNWSSNVSPITAVPTGVDAELSTLQYLLRAKIKNIATRPSDS